jgi:HEAT repeat protein
MPLIRKPAASIPPSPVDPAKVLVALATGTEDERWEAARAAADIPGAAKALGETLLRERNPRVREAAFTSLARISTAESVELMIPLLRSDDAQLRTGALDALRTMTAVVRGYVPQLLHDVDADVRLLACELARNLPGEESARLLCELLESELEPNVCASAVEVLAEVGGPEALPVLARCADRFRGTSFIEFAIEITADRIRSPSSEPRA